MHSFTSAVSLLLAWFLAAAHSRSLQGISPESDAVHRDEIFRGFETKFLGMMGLKSKPRVTRETVMPRYMIDLYNSEVEDQNYVTTNLVFKDFATTANTVRAFYHTDVRNNDISNSSKRHIILDIETVPEHEDLVKAELRIYCNASEKLDGYARHIISVYQILQPGVGTKSVKRLLDSRVVDATADGWLNYDILKAVQDWRERPAENHGLELDIVSENGNPIDISHLRIDKPGQLEEEMWPHHRPLLAVYTRDPNTHYHKERLRRSSQEPRRTDLCRRHELIVNFKLLNWGSWVIAPNAYNAYYCQGACVYPLATHMNTTNHAIVQTLVHNVMKKDPGRKGPVPPPTCCIPTSFEPLRMLYYEGDGDNARPVLRKYKQMVVTGCGCR